MLPRCTIRPRWIAAQFTAMMYVLASEEYWMDIYTNCLYDLPIWLLIHLPLEIQFFICCYQKLGKGVMIGQNLETLIRELYGRTPALASFRFPGLPHMQPPHQLHDSVSAPLRFLGKHRLHTYTSTQHKRDKQASIYTPHEEKL